VLSNVHCNQNQENSGSIRVAYEGCSRTDMSNNTHSNSLWRFCDSYNKLSHLRFRCFHSKDERFTGGGGRRRDRLTRRRCMKTRKRKQKYNNIGSSKIRTGTYNISCRSYNI